MEEKAINETKEAAALIHNLNDRNFLFFRGMVQTAAAFFMNPQAQEQPKNALVTQEKVGG